MICDCCKHSKDCCKIISENTFCSSYEYNSTTIVFADGNMLSMGDTLYYVDCITKSILEYYVLDIVKSSRKIVVSRYTTLTGCVMSFDDINHNLFLTKQEAIAKLRRLVFMKCEYCEHRNTCTAIVSKNTSLIRCFSVDKSTVRIGDTIYVIRCHGNFYIEKAEVTELYSNTIFCNKMINPL